MKSKTSKFHGYSVNDLKRFKDEILIRRGQLKEATPGLMDDASWEIEGSGVGSSDGDQSAIRESGLDQSRQHVNKTPKTGCWFA